MSAAALGEEGADAGAAFGEEGAEGADAGAAFGEKDAEGADAATALGEEGPGAAALGEETGTGAATGELGPSTGITRGCCCWDCRRGCSLGGWGAAGAGWLLAAADACWHGCS